MRVCEVRVSEETLDRDDGGTDPPSIQAELVCLFVCLWVRGCVGVSAWVRECVGAWVRAW